ncbi:MAG: DNA mismatch repair endonuclease MutL [Cyclobacteriaceae bacterium]|nr:DNA mismatch repair endonuclease MutL [Cyclobacteriaceae bacterium]
MSDIIQLLPDSIANQIAAGEVVQRPASAVKELMENSIDAGATEITLIIKDAGKGLIQVIDNGMGMTETDARMSMERHATSKIRKADDLFTLRTMGFRGEALASIAAVSQLDLKTRQADKELGTLLVVEASEVKRQEVTACEKGTNISVKNLFYNIPARRNFLKSNPVETKHIIDEFQRLALSHSDISFIMIQGDDTVYDLPPGKLSHRVVNLFGKSFQEQLAACQEETEFVRVTGYIGKPEFARKTRGEQFLFVNNRFIRSNYLHHAVMNAFEGLMPVNSYPFYVLFIEIDPKHIDVNVHPTKTEIKFDDERAVYAVVRAAVRQALGAHSMTPGLDFSEDVNLIAKLNSASSETAREVYFEERFQSSLKRTNLQNWEKLFEGEGVPGLKFQGKDLSPNELEFLKSKQGEEIPQVSQETFFQLHNRFVLRQVKTGLMIIDQQAAHERILYEKFMVRINASSGESQQSLFPQTVTFNPADFALIMEMENEIKALGFRFEEFGKNTLVINGIPSGIVSGQEKDLFEGLIDQFKSNQSVLSLPLKENLTRALAKRAALKPGERLNQEAMTMLVKELLQCKASGYSPDGEVTYFIFDLAKIEMPFKRY